MSIITSYNNLDGKITGRSYIKGLITRAKNEKETTVINKLSKLLKKYPKATNFELSVKPIKESGLKGLQHKGIAKKALNNCGRLKPGHAFKKGGKIEKVDKKKKSPTLKKEPTNITPKGYTPLKYWSELPTKGAKIKINTGNNIKPSFKIAKIWQHFNNYVVLSYGNNLTRKVDKDKSTHSNIFVLLPKNEELPKKAKPKVKKVKKQVLPLKKVLVKGAKKQTPVKKITTKSKNGQYGLFGKKQKINNREVVSQKKEAGLRGVLNPASNLVEKTVKPPINRTKTTKSVSDFINAKFNPVPTKKIWKELIGDFEFPTHILLTGAGGHGKSGMAFNFAQDMTELGYKVLYASPEQYNSPTLGQLFRDAKIRPDNNLLEISNEYENEHHNPGMFDIVVLDSKDSFGITNPKDFEELKKRYPKTSFIIMSQATKEGTFSGSGKWRNVVDVMLEAYERGKMRTGEKNRWNQYGDVVLFKSKENKTKDPGPEVKIPKKVAEVVNESSNTTMYV